MSDGWAVGTANASLTTSIQNAAYIQLHTGAPGNAGTANVSSVTTRMAVTWGAPAAGVVSASNQPQWVAWAGTNGEIVTDISFWSAATGGTFAGSMQLSSSANMSIGDSLTLTSIQTTIPTAS